MDKETKATILIVDDNPKNVQVCGTILRPEGYRIAIAYSGAEALKAVEKSLPDLILLDIMMPEMDGFETCERIKALPQTERIPIIFLTARTGVEDIVKGFELGAVDYVTKPFNSTELTTRIKTHLDLKFKTDLIMTVSDNRKQLIHVLCHDLMNPIGAIESFLTLIRGNEYTKCMKLAMGNCKNIIGIVRTYCAFDDKKIVMNLCSINLMQAVHEAIQLIQYRFDDKGVSVEIEIDDSLLIKAEKTSVVNSVISNILTNAIKFSYSETSIAISSEQDETTVKLIIRDYGIGMSEMLLADLFDISKTTNREGTEGESGTGFGMPLVKRFMEGYGGAIFVSSKEGRDAPDDHGTEVVLVFEKGT